MEEILKSYIKFKSSVSFYIIRYYFYHVLKRAKDLIISLSVLILISPVMLLIALLIKLLSPGPILFLQSRVGRHGHLFKMIKFRTMHVGAKETVQLKDDPRVFKFGKILRTTSIDELPQLLNVLKGDMSLVGPRPLIKEEIKCCNEYQLDRLTVKPGLSGLSQINGRGDLDFKNRMKMDVEYTKQMSLFLDLTILLKTIFTVLTRRGAY